MQRYSTKLYRTGGCKWGLRNVLNILTAGMLVASVLLLRLNYQSVHHQRSMQHSTKSRTYNNPRSVIAVINTPRMGTASLSQTFINSWNCTNGQGYPSYLTHNCPDERMIVQTHDVDAAAKAIKRHRQEYPGGKCLIVTAIRSPATWFPSLYSQESRICGASSMSKHDMLQDYKRFLGDTNVIEQTTGSCLPRLMNEFEGGSLREQDKIMDYSGGYSTLGPASAESVIAGCQLLFLRMEQSNRWSGFINKFVPGSEYHRGKSQISKCPELREHIKMLQDYELSKEEKVNIYNHGGVIIPDWFDSYKYFEGSSQIERGPYTEPGTVIAVINTAKAGTGGLTQNFARLWGCTDSNHYLSHITFKCPKDRLVIRSHQFDGGMQAIQQHQQKNSGGKCLIITAMRNPAAWLPSLYIQQTHFCANVTMTKDAMFKDYKNFIATGSFIASSAESCLPALMKEFNFGSLVEQAKIMDQNGGYSILAPSSSESSLSGCELLFLRMEESDQWPEIIQLMVPTNEFLRGQSRTSQCPDLAEHIQMLQDYDLTRDERVYLHNYGKGFMADWFDAYEYVKEEDLVADQ